MKFNWNNPYPTIRVPVMGRNVVSTSHPFAAQAGLKMIQQGGNAIDAAIAAPGAIEQIDWNTTSRKPTAFFSSCATYFLRFRFSCLVFISGL